MRGATVKTLIVCYSQKFETDHFAPTHNSIKCSENVSKVTRIDLMGKGPKFESCAAL